MIQKMIRMMMDNMKDNKAKMSRTKNEEDGVLDKEKLIINIKEVIHI